MKKFNSNVKKMDLIIGIYIAALVMAELMGGKLFVINELFDSIWIGKFFDIPNIFSNPLRVSVAVFLLPILFSINDIVSEVLGKERAKSIVRTGLYMVGFIAIFSLFSTTLPDSVNPFVPEAPYDTIFHNSLRVSLASLVAFAISEFFDVFIYSKIKAKFNNKGLWFRNNLSNFIGQLLDTTIFITLAYFNFTRPNVYSIFTIILPYWLLKSLMSILVTPFVYLGVKWLKKGE